MKKQHPGFEMFLPVLNIGAEQTSACRSELKVRHLGEQGASQAIRRLTVPSKQPKAHLILSSEMSALQGRAKVKQPSEEHITELKQYVDETLPESWRLWTIRTPTLPIRFDQIHRREILSVAGCQQALKARNLAKQVLARFYGMEQAPRDIWKNDNRVVRPVIAQAYGGGVSRELLYELGSMLEHDEAYTLLPHTTQLGGVVTRLVIPGEQTASADVS